jgi:hypothetical protein
MHVFVAMVFFLNRVVISLRQRWQKQCSIGVLAFDGNVFFGTFQECVQTSVSMKYLRTYLGSGEGGLNWFMASTDALFSAGPGYSKWRPSFLKGAKTGTARK